MHCTELPHLFVPALSLPFSSPTQLSSEIWFDDFSQGRLLIALHDVCLVEFQSTLCSPGQPEKLRITEEGLNVCTSENKVEYLFFVFFLKVIAENKKQTLQGNIIFLYA